MKKFIIIIVALYMIQTVAMSAPVPTAPAPSTANIIVEPIKPSIRLLPAEKIMNKETSPTESEIISKPAQQKVKKTSAKLETIEDIREQAKFLYNSNNLTESLEMFNRIGDADKISDDWLFLANIAQDNAKIIDAIFFLKKAIQSDEKNYKAHYNLGNIYFSDGKINMALAEYKKVLRIKKDYSYAYYNKGCCYLKKKSWYNAKYEFGLAIKENPNEPSFYYNLAYTYKMMKKDKKAQEALEMYNKLMVQ